MGPFFEPMATSVHDVIIDIRDICLVIPLSRANLSPLKRRAEASQRAGFEPGMATSLLRPSPDRNRKTRKSLAPPSSPPDHADPPAPLPLPPLPPPSKWERRESIEEGGWRFLRCQLDESRFPVEALGGNDL